MGPFQEAFSLFYLFNTVDSKQMCFIKVCRWLDLNRRPLVSEATALSTALSTEAQQFNQKCTQLTNAILTYL